MTGIQGTYFDGNFLRPHPAVLELSPDHLVTMRTEARVETFPLDAVRFSERLGSLPRFVYLPGGGTIETVDNDRIDVALAATRRRSHAGWIHRLEAHSPTAAVATALLIGLVLASFHFGLPVLARKTAAQVPVELEVKAGKAALASFERLLGPTSLSQTERQRVLGLMHRLNAEAVPQTAIRVEFRSMHGHQANAFALPGGIIVVSDGLVRLTHIDDELTAVLAHELGHLELRHGIQSLLRSSFALLLVTSLTGDLSTLTSFAGTLPFVLMQNGYSHEFEREADTYARDLLIARGIKPGHLASILRKLEASMPPQAHQNGYLNTHPGTDERVRFIDPDGNYPALAPGPVVPASVVHAVAPAPKMQSLSMPLEVRSLRSVYTFPPLDTPPVALRQPLPEFSPYLRSLASSGQVAVDFIVDRNGDVRAAYVTGATSQIFGITTLATIETWKFHPGFHRGESANAHLAFVFHFTGDQVSAVELVQPQPRP